MAPAYYLSYYLSYYLNARASMSRVTEDAKITTKAAREGLAPRHEPYWRGVEGGLAVGYRKGSRGGVWMARCRDGSSYKKITLGRADDQVGATVERDETLGEAEAATVLTFAQAQAAATRWAKKLHRVAAGLEAEAPAAPMKPYTVADALNDYLADYEARGGKSLQQTKNAINAHIIPALGGELVARLTRDKLRRWHRGLATAPARLRASKGKINIREDNDNDDAPRRRRATANRILTILKAALNHAKIEGAVSCSDDPWKLLLPFKQADAPKIRYLLDEEAARLVNACAGDFRDLVVVALLTGCRYGELCKLKVNDFDRQAGTLQIRVPKGGKPRHVVLSDEGRIELDRLTIGRPQNALVLMRDTTVKQATKQDAAELRRAAWGPAHQHRPIKEACTAANIVPAISFHVLRHTYASRLAMRGAPMTVIAAQLGHRDTRITERHYAHLAPSYVSDVFRGAFGNLGITKPDAQVVPLHRAGA